MSSNIQPDEKGIWPIEQIYNQYYPQIKNFIYGLTNNFEVAEDLTQEFFSSRVITKRIFEGLQPGAGRFRSWLLTCLQNMVFNQRERQQAQKRGGSHEHVSLDFRTAEGRYLAEPADTWSPEKVYERSWALTLLARALDLLQQKYNSEGNAALFAELKTFLPGEQSNRSYAEVAAALGKSEPAVKMAVSRLRQEYGRVLYSEIKRTVTSSKEADEELRYLMSVLAD